MEMTDIELAKKATASNFLLFCKRMWPAVSSDPFSIAYHVEVIAEHLQAIAEREISRLILLCPIRHSKSILTSILFPAFLWTRNQSERIITSTYSQELTMQFAGKTRQLLESDLYKSYFPEIKFTDDSNRKGFYTNSAKGQRLSVSTGGRCHGFDADVILEDDPINYKERNSELMRKEVIDFFEPVLCSRLVKTGREAVVVCGHRYHEDDLYAQLRQKYGDSVWTWCVLPSEANNKFSSWYNKLGWKDKRQEGEPLWPERYGDYSADKIEQRNDYSAIYLQCPVPAEGSLFKKEWFRYWTDETIDGVEYYKIDKKMLRKDKAWRFMTVDTAISTNPDADYTVIQTWDIIGQYKLLVNQIRKRLDGTKLVPTIKSEYDVRQPQFVSVEAEFVGLMVLDQLSNKNFDDLSQQNVIVKKFQAKNFGDKEQRAVGAEIAFEAGQIWFPADAPYLTELQNELLAFPSGTHDDQVDACSMMAALATKYQGAVEEIVTPEEAKKKADKEEQERFNRRLWAGSEFRRFRK